MHDSSAGGPELPGILDVPHTSMAERQALAQCEASQKLHVPVECCLCAFCKVSALRNVAEVARRPASILLCGLKCGSSSCAGRRKSWWMPPAPPMPDVETDMVADRAAGPRV